VNVQTEPSADLTVTAALDALPRCTAFVAAFASAAGFSADRVREIELVVEEIVANICRHGYSEQSGALQISCRRGNRERLDLLFVDRGRPFDLLAVPATDLDTDLDKREIGGLGVPLVRALVEEASYRRDGDRNLLHLIVGAQRPGAEARSTR
jgi:anti-sigma regulatory factor (Ser/Thr protein kinase)